MNPRNSLSLAVMLRNSVGEEFSDELFFNTDVTSLHLKDHGETVSIPIEMVEALGEERLSVCKTKDQSFQERSMSSMTTLPAVGKLLCTIALIFNSDVSALHQMKVPHRML